MTFPICDSCASSGVLCAECEEKARAGLISELDILVSSILAEHGLSGYESLIELDTKLVIVASEAEAPRIIGVKGAIAGEISRKLGRRIVVLSKNWEKEQIISSLAHPSKLVSIKKVEQKDGKIKLKLIFNKLLDDETVTLLKSLVGELEITYEKAHWHVH